MTETSAGELERLRSENERLTKVLEQNVRASAAKELQLERYAADLRETFKRERTRAHQLHDSYIVTVRALSNAVEARDAYTANHAERVAAYGLALARELELELADDPAIEFGFLLHDVGKVAISDSILHKPGPLTAEERSAMEQHPLIGFQIVADVTFLGSAAAVVRSHHERWDGAGYPDRLSGEQIPLAARVFAVADVLDALTTIRPYRDPMPLAEARALICGDRGTHFDPAVIAAFERIPEAKLTAIAEAGT
ncbi:MAG: HD domain-containing protein [Solirubrobacterales bacterium]|nr:HD domain-containing protein [Solirubrobacterales bacterium]